MTTKTDYQSVIELKKVYSPAMRGVISVPEEKLIREVLELTTRNDIELQNARDTVTMMYSRWASSPKRVSNIPAIVDVIDAMSSICCVIDHEKSKRGLPV